MKAKPRHSWVIVLDTPVYTEGLYKVKVEDSYECTLTTSLGCLHRLR